MQHPVGYVLRNGRAEMNDFVAVITQPFAIQQYFHTVSGAYILSGFAVMGISAYHLLRRQHTSFFTMSFRLALTFALIFSVAEVVQGHIHGAEVAFYGTSENAVLIQIWTAMIAYLFLLWLKVRSWAGWSILELTRLVQNLIMERCNLWALLCPRTSDLPDYGQLTLFNLGGAH
jgi:hypothetical protein